MLQTFEKPRACLFPPRLSFWEITPKEITVKKKLVRGVYKKKNFRNSVGAQ